MEDDTLYDKVTLPLTDVAPRGGETPFFLVILLLIFLPPAAWFVLWKEKEYHHWFSFLIGFYSLLAIFGSIIIRQVFQPQVTALYQSLHIAEPSVTPFAYLNIYIFLGVIELLAAVVVYIVTKKYKVLPKLWLIISVTILACNSVLQPLSLLYFTYESVQSVYNQERNPNLSKIPHVSSQTKVVNVKSEDWSTYTNMDQYLILQYPTNWQVTENFSAEKTFGYLWVSFTSIPYQECFKDPYSHQSCQDVGLAIYIGESMISYNSLKSRPLNKPETLTSGSPNDRIITTTVERGNDKVVDNLQGLYEIDTGGIKGKDGTTTNNTTYRVYVHLNNLYFVFNASSEKLLNRLISTVKFTDQAISPTCRPRPACLDATPRCLIAETADMCPAPTK